MSLQHHIPEKASSVRANTGPFASEQVALDEVVKRLVSGLDPEQIWLFGSRAEGRHRPDSDFDVMVVTRTNSGDSGFDHDAVYAPIVGLGVGCDVVLCRADDFEAERNDPTSLSGHVVLTGKMLYDPSMASRMIERPRPRTTPPVSAFLGAGEA
ncbi:MULTISPECIES: nucleotidyltransferase domain-containing protein [unclassified Bradyrhizobium]|uniref:nucleotidyltransferase domain-containing protein n=1 Tax=unclassified Bradyrhizobium TaxID=2631580 RepID=UPI002FEFBDFE